MDYSLLVLKHNLSVTREFNESIFIRMEDESNFVINVLENFQIIFEEAQVASTTDKNQANVFQRLAEFFKKIFGTFAEKTKAIFESNKAWMDENFNKFDKIDYSKLKIQMIPFWTMGMNRLKSDSYVIQRKIQKVMSNKSSLEKYKDLDAIKKDIYSEYLDTNDDLTNGLKNYYRVGNSKSSNEAVSLEGPSLKEKVAEFKTYCFNYGKDIAPYVKALMDEAEKDLQRIEKTLKARPATENFCLVENALYLNTDLAQSNNFILLEAEEPVKPDAPKPDEKPANHTDVKIVNKADEGQKAEDDANTKYSGLSTVELIFLKNTIQIKQLSISALMTVLEERFRAYMNALKAILKEAGQTTENTPDVKNTKKAMGDK